MPKKILLADDSITIQKVIGITFANEDYELTVVDNGVDAITKAKEIMPDLVLADVVMPQKDGYEVCREIKADPSLSSIPVILLKGTFEAFDEAKSKEVGADDDITKPFESQTLIAKVKEHLEKSSAGPSATQEPAPAATPEPAPSVPETAPAPAATPEPAFDDVVDLKEDEVMQTQEADAGGEDMWGDSDFGDVEGVSTESQTQPAVKEEAVSEDEMWGDMDLGETEEVTSVEPGGDESSVEESQAAADDEFADFETDEDMSSEIEGVEVESFMKESPASSTPPVVEEPVAESPAAPAAAPGPVPASGGVPEGDVSAAISQVSREIIEKIAWEVVPELAETLIKEEIKRLKGE